MRVKRPATFSLVVVLAGLVIALFLAEVPTAGAGARPVAMDGGRSGETLPSVFVDASTTTWMRRGRTLMDIEGLVRKKLSSAGFRIVPQETDPRDLLVSVDYREDRGVQYSVDSYGTEITCRIRLEQGEGVTLFNLVVRESSGDQMHGTPPYLEAIHKFQTNAYVYLLGDLVKGRAVRGEDVTESLIRGLARLAEADPADFDPRSATHTMMDFESGYATQARANTIRELGQLKVVEAIPLLTELLDHSEPQVRELSASALGAIGAPESRSALERVADQDGDPRVRDAARTALSRLKSVPLP